MLMNDLNRMSIFHLKNDSRFQEIERRISLRRDIFKLGDDDLLFDKVSDMKLNFEFNEQLFDSDYPGHYFRVIKTIALSLKTGESIDENEKSLLLPRLTLTQVGNKVITKPDFAAVQSLLGVSTDEVSDPNVLRVDWRSREMVTISRWEEDNGMFNTDWIFDDRYFPFEGTGAVSSWQLELGKKFCDNQVDMEEILRDVKSDIIMTVKYTANFDGGLRDKVKNEIESLI